MHRSSHTPRPCARPLGLSQLGFMEDAAWASRPLNQKGLGHRTGWTVWLQRSSHSCASWEARGLCSDPPLNWRCGGWAGFEDTHGGGSILYHPRPPPRSCPLPGLVRGWGRRLLSQAAIVHPPRAAGPFTRVPSACLA